MKFTTRLREALRPIRDSEREAAYLNEATSLVDLESRQREIDRGRYNRNRSAF
ncbi:MULTISPECIES: DUF3563 family protein [unclassified Aureimonas]|uniref:DUF3563 family protein n=1 Tax=unclassified Aureimonas TaxID=2615206 RepID=UPI00071EA38D|nr:MULTISPECIES: DUF3563 family protein [unclassified Aureimonas]ALN72016.1 hypothetical protein M673_04765 [Aureimonas sp. AU20]